MKKLLAAAGLFLALSGMQASPPPASPAPLSLTRLDRGAKVIIQHEPADVAKLPASPAAAQ